MLTLITTPNGQRLVRSTTKRQAVDHVVKGTITAKTISADELADLLDAVLKIENADFQDPTIEDATDKADSDGGEANNQGGENVQ